MKEDPRRIIESAVRVEPPREGLELPAGHIDEGKLSRLLTHAKRPFAMLSAFTGEHDRRTNLARNKQLMQVLRARGMGPIRLIGHWRDEPGDPEQVEDSFFVPKPPDMTEDEFHRFMFRVGIRFDQKAVLVGGSQGVRLLWKGGREEKLGSLTIGKAGSVYSRMRGQSGVPFRFEGACRPRGWSEALLFEALGLSWSVEDAAA